MAKFEKKVALVNDFNGEYIVLEKVEDGFYKVPEGAWLYMAVGDTYKVEEVESEVE